MDNNTNSNTNNNINNNNNNKPKMFLVFKILGFLFIGISLILSLFAMLDIIDVVSSFGNSSPSTDDFRFPTKFLLLMISGPLFTIGIVLLFIGFRPEMSKLHVKSHKYIQNQNKEDLKDITSGAANITKDAITTTAKAIKEGLSDNDTKFCKYCGEKIDEDSNYCNQCGKKQD